MEILIEQLVPTEIAFLNDKDNLFILDYRAIWESFDYEIPSMRKYENIAPWILENQNILVNQNASFLRYKNKNNLIQVDTWKTAKISIIKRVENFWNFKNIYFKNIFAFIPHPEIDKFCKDNKKNLFYTYEDFLLFNNKISQKSVVKYTPQWKLIKDFQDISTLNNKQNFYVKRSLWSWWFTVFKADKIQQNNKFSNLLKDWWNRYIEEKVDGLSMSIQIYKDKNKCVIFWLTRQEIKNEKEFCWAELLNLNFLKEDKFLKQRLIDCVEKLSNKLLSSYVWFFWIDFIYDKQNKVFWFLEWNIRLTTMTIPTLIYNNNPLYNIFKEDVRKELLKPSDMILWYDTIYDCYDILTFI